MDIKNYFSQSQLSSLSKKDEIYDKIADYVEKLIESFSEGKDKQIFLQVINKSYLKYKNSITKGDENSMTELIIKMLMASIYSKFDFWFIFKHKYFLLNTLLILF